MEKRVALARVKIVAGRFNEAVTRKLLAGALAALGEKGVARGDVAVHWVAGAFEIPQAAERLARQKPAPAAIIALGCILQGETDHHAHLGSAVVDHLLSVARENGVPVGLGVVSAKTPEQAMARAGGSRGNRGADAANAALSLAEAFRKIPGKGRK